MSSRSRYCVYSAIGLAMLLPAAALRGLFAGLPPAGALAALSDCFLVPGALLTGFGGLSWISSKGGYDSFGYGGEMLLSRFNLRKDFRAESYFDYRERRRKSRRPWQREPLLVGLIFFGLSVIFTLIFSVI